MSPRQVPLEIIITSEQPLPPEAYTELVKIFQEATGENPPTLTIDVPTKWGAELGEPLKATGAEVREVTPMGVHFDPEQVRIFLEWYPIVAHAMVAATEAGTKLAPRVKPMTDALAKKLKQWWEKHFGQGKSGSAKITSDDMVDPKDLAKSEKDIADWLTNLTADDDD